MIADRRQLAFVYRDFLDFKLGDFSVHSTVVVCFLLTCTCVHIYKLDSLGLNSYISHLQEFYILGVPIVEGHTKRRRRSYLRMGHCR